MKKFAGIGRYVVCALLLIGIFSAFALRLFQWQIVDGQSYYDLSNTTVSSYIKLTATRGEILDRNGKELAKNRTCYNIVFDDTLIDHEKLNDTILELIGIMEETKSEWIDVLPIQLEADGTYSFKEDYDSEIEFLKSSSMLHMNSYATADECMKQLIEMFDCQDYDPQDAIKIISVRYNMKKNLFDADSPYTFAKDISADVMTVVNERTANMPGVRVDVSTIREYPDGALAPHIIGKTGPLSAEQYDEIKKENNTFSLENLSGYSYDDTIGQNGIEWALEDTLRGENGKLTLETDREGNLTSSEIEVSPKAGNTVYLTLDSRIQSVVNTSLAKNAKAAKENAVPTEKDPKGADCEAGAAVMIDLKTGAVLAASTYPTYDLNKYISDIAYYNQLNNDETFPMINRAFSGTFAPGSIFKPVVAAAALEEGIINPTSTVYCGHYYTYYTQDTKLAPTCMGWHYDTNIYKALEKSCNPYFVSLIQLTGGESVAAKAAAIGFGSPLELADGITASAGRLPTYEELAVPGQTANFGFGQGYLTATPLQIAQLMATVANDGAAVTPKLIAGYTGDGQTISEYTPTYSPRQVIRESAALQVQQMMIQVVEEGSGTKARPKALGAGGKTASAQTGTYDENGEEIVQAWFAGFYPADEPQYAIAVLAEGMESGGDYAAPVFAEICDRIAELGKLNG